MKRTQRITWRWAERDYGFRFCSGSGKRLAELYQAAKAGEFYQIPAGQRKFKKDRIEELRGIFPEPTAPAIVASPWRNYGDTDLQHITGLNGAPCINFAGCLSKEEIESRETHGVNRAKEYIADLALREDPAPITLDLIHRAHEAMLGDIYPWAGQWRTVSLHKGEGSTKWPLPVTGMEPVMLAFEQDVLSRTPFLSEDDDELFSFVGEFMGEFLALHPFREGNGRTAFILAELILLQNDLLPLDDYNRKRDEQRYFAACEDARLKKDYTALASLVAEWQAEAQASFAEIPNENL